MSKQVAGIILAAGDSSRFGSPKQLLPWRETTVLNSVVKTAIEVRLLPVVVVLGANADLIRPGLPEGCVVVTNAEWSEGQSSSIRIGLSQLPQEIDGVLILLGDQPQVNPNFCEGIVQRGLENRKITIPYVNDRVQTRFIFQNIRSKDLEKSLVTREDVPFSQNSRWNFFPGWMTAWQWILTPLKIMKN